jgi:hypothetical protein
MNTRFFPAIRRIMPVAIGRKVLFSGLAMMVVMTACTKKDYPENLSIIPKESSLVACINLKTLVEKADLGNLEKSIAYKSLEEGLFSSQPALRKIAEDPTKSGIKFSEAFLFLTGGGQTGASFELKSASQFEAALQAIATEANTTLVIHSETGCHYTLLSENDQLSLVWDKQKALLIMSKMTQDEAVALFNTPQDSGILTVSDFVAFYRQKKDLSLWIRNDKATGSLNALLKTPVSGAEKAGTELLKGTFTHVSIEFKTGEIACTSETTPVEQAKKVNTQYVRTPPDNNLLSYFPQKTYLMGHLSLNLPAIIQQLSKSGKDTTALKSAGIYRAAEALDGNLAFSVFDFAEGMIPLPRFILAAGVKDPSIYTDLLTLIPPMVQQRQTGSYTTISFGDIAVYLAQNKQYLMATNDEAMMQSFVANRPQKVSLLDATPISTSRDSPASFYFNLDLSTYPPAILNLLGSFTGSSNALAGNDNGNGNEDPKIKDLFFMKDMLLAYHPETATGELTFHLKDTRRNSLAVILQKASEWAASN